MKKILTLLCLIASSANTFAGLRFINYFNQEQAKKDLIFTDGVSFAQVEKDIKEKHPHIPDVLLVDCYLDQKSINDLPNKIPAPFYFPKGTNVTATIAVLNQDGSSKLENKTFENPILANSEFKQLDSHGAKWLLTHETGHAKYPNLIPTIRIISLPVFLSTTYAWKKIINSKPYKNRVTKYSSKLFAGLCASNSYVQTAIKLEERRADNYANQHTDKRAILSAKNYFQNTKHHLQELWNSYKLSKILPFSIGQYIIDPMHPSIDSRIRKLTKAAHSKE